MNHSQVIEDLVAWAAENHNIRLVVLTGSVARGTGVDELSDLDVELYVRDSNEFLADRKWYLRFGDVLAVEELENPGWNPTRLVYYVDGKIDFMIGALGVLGAGVSYDRAFQVLLDKDGLSHHLSADTTVKSPPDDEEYRRCVHWFASAALTEARDIVRDEPWMMKIRERDLMDELLQMIEWDHRVRYGWDFDTWYLGAHMRRWMDADVQQALEGCWAGFSLDDGRDALMASIELFDRLCRSTAAALAFEPFDVERIRSEVIRILAHRG